MPHRHARHRAAALQARLRTWSGAAGWRMHKGDLVMLLALASGIEIGIAIFAIDSQVEHYGHTH